MSRKARKGLTAMELNILQLLWAENRPLLRNEILEMLPDHDFNPISLYGVLNSMIDRKMISVEGKYNRTYQAILTQDEYAASQLKALTPNMSPSSRITGVLSFFLHHEELDSDTIAELETMLQDYREGLKKDGN